VELEKLSQPAPLKGNESSSKRQKAIAELLASERDFHRDMQACLRGNYKTLLFFYLNIFIFRLIDTFFQRTYHRRGLGLKLLR
jgi:hypothetical protein